MRIARQKHVRLGHVFRYVCCLLCIVTNLVSLASIRRMSHVYLLSNVQINAMTLAGDAAE